MFHIVFTRTILASRALFARLAPPLDLRSTRAHAPPATLGGESVPERVLIVRNAGVMLSVMLV